MFPSNRSKQVLLQPYSCHLSENFRTIHATSQHIIYFYYLPLSITCFTVPFQALLPAFCNAYEDPAILGDARVLANMLWVERAYVPAPPALCYGRDGTQDEIKPHMRRIVVEWMLDVCVDQRCNVDVFLLATNIIDRFLSTIRLEE